MQPLSLYIHIPYCEHKCIYCDFYSVINGKYEREYFKTLVEEIKFRASQYFMVHEVRTIFFGGGTPSLVKTEYLAKVLNAISKFFQVTEKPEITIEANPGTLDDNKIKEYLTLGVNRLSLGVQSFFDDDLKFLTRIHSSQEAIESVEKAYSGGFENINIDLIFNLPGQTKSRWKENLGTAVRLPVKHISAYSLILERGTILNKMVLDGKVKIGDADYDADLYETTQEFLAENGFEQYEVSNFAKTNYECEHNKAYWEYKNYLGFGASSHSFIKPKRWKNFTSLTHYLLSAQEKGERFVASEEVLTEQEQLEEYVMLALRGKGLDLNELNILFGDEFYEKNKKIISELERNLLLINSDNKICLTQKGYALCDEILLKFEY